MEAFFVSIGVVALSEIGDKTQLLAFLLAARFKKTLPVIAAILCATIINHGLAGFLGAWITSAVNPRILQWTLGLSFFAIAIWSLIPDKLDDKDSDTKLKSSSIFGTTFIAFFLAEMGDKTQLATIALAAHYAMPLAVVAGTTLGMLVADVPAVLLGEKLVAKLPLKAVRIIAAAVFAIMGVATFIAGNVLIH